MQTIDKHCSNCAREEFGVCAQNIKEQCGESFKHWVPLPQINESSFTQVQATIQARKQAAYEYKEKVSIEVMKLLLEQEDGIDIEKLVEITFEISNAMVLAMFGGQTDE